MSKTVKNRLIEVEKKIVHDEAIEKAKEILAKKSPKIVAIPDGVSVIPSGIIFLHAQAGSLKGIQLYIPSRPHASRTEFCV